MTTPIIWQTVVRYSYDGEREIWYLDVEASSENEAREKARAEARSILEPGIAFRVTDVEPKHKQEWSELRAVFTPEERSELVCQLNWGRDPAEDVRIINDYMNRYGRWDSLRAIAVKPDTHAGIIVQWNDRVTMPA